MDSNKKYLFFYLSDLLDYFVIPDNDREDYSPVNTVVDLNKTNKAVELKKEKRSKILTARAFTDFVGVQADEPNGLIQIEASKKFYINTAKYGGSYMYHSFGHYVEPVLSISKIEKKNNALPLTYSALDTNALKGGVKHFNIEPIDLYRYQKSAFDISINAWKINLPELKLNFQINGSAGIMGTNVVDTISVIGNNATVKSPTPNTEVINTLRLGWSIICEVKLESRFGISFGYDVRQLNLLNEAYSFPLLDTAIKIKTVWTDAFLKTNDDNKLFFRFRFTFDRLNTKKNFAQAQLGYLMDLFKSKK
jgi:hypothetical protein